MYAPYLWTVIFWIIPFQFALTWPLTALARRLSNMLNSYVEKSSLNFNNFALFISPFIFLLVLVLPFIAFIMFNYWPCILHLFKNYHTKVCSTWLNVISASNKIIMRYFSFNLFLAWVMLMYFVCLILHASLLFGILDHNELCL